VRQREHAVGPAQSETPRTHGFFLHGNREILRPLADHGAAGRIGKAEGRTPMMHDRRKSDGLVVPGKPPNNAGSSAAEEVEGRSPAEGNAAQRNTSRTQSRTNVPSALDRVREAARKDRKMKFTALFHHLTVERLHTSFMALRRHAAAGVDGVTWAQYEADLADNLRDLHERLHRGAYRAKPSRRVFIPKADGRQRPLGIASLEDKIVQRAVVEILNAIYETDFLGFSYGFRPGRSQHQALDALATGLTRKKVSMVLDADIRGFFDAIDHGWMLRFLEHRIADRRILRLIQKWLTAGVLHEGTRTESRQGSPQGATVSPLLANVYLHYVLDLWIQRWRKTQTDGEVIAVRYADDFVVGFQGDRDATQFLNDLRERLAKFGLELHPEKTRLIEFGRTAARARKARGEGKPETFAFLGFTHICGIARSGNFLLLRRTEAKRMRAKLHEIKVEMQRRQHVPVPAQGAWLQSVVRGYFAYHAVPTNVNRMSSFRTQVGRIWLHALRRRGQRDRTNWARMKTLETRWLPRARVLHPWPEQRFAARTRGKSPVR
jgi:RNA-directed DNA polymerase